MEPVIRAGETYVLPRDMSRETALAYWHCAPYSAFVAEYAGEIVGTYHLKANPQGGGAHVANCGYMTARGATGRGVARTKRGRGGFRRPRRAAYPYRVPARAAAVPADAGAVAVGRGRAVLRRKTLVDQ